MQYILSDIEIESIYNEKLDIYFIKNKFMYTENLIPNEITFELTKDGFLIGFNRLKVTI